MPCDKTSYNSTPIPYRTQSIRRGKMFADSHRMKFTRFLYENKLHFPCNQYVGTKIDIFAEITKHSADFKVIALVCCLAVGWDHPVPLEISLMDEKIVGRFGVFRFDLNESCCGPFHFSAVVKIRSRVCGIVSE